MCQGNPPRRAHQEDRFEGLREWVDVYSLAIDGPDAQAADWFRGVGYFDRFTANVAMLAGNGKTLAFNTFTAGNSIGRLAETAAMIRSIGQRTSVEYWLISQYRPIGRADARKADVYGFTPDEFRAAVAAVRADMGAARTVVDADRFGALSAGFWVGAYNDLPRVPATEARQEPQQQDQKPFTPRALQANQPCHHGKNARRPPRWACA